MVYSLGILQVDTNTVQKKHKQTELNKKKKNPKNIGWG